jgi:phage gp29-like protein
MADVYSLPLPTAEPLTTDPAWQPPRDPLKDAHAGVIAREIPVITTQTHWSWGDVRAALDDLRVGIFDRPAQLMEAILWDARVQAAMGSRTGGLLGRPVKIEPADNARVRGSAAARECAEAWADVWPTIARESAFATLHTQGVMLFGLAQLLWDTSGSVWVPHLVPFHPRYTYYQFVFRKLIAITLDGQMPVTPGDGHWVLHAPYGEHRGWMRGAITALAQPWIQRNFTYRDVARYTERHGFPMLRAKVPAAADPRQIATLRNALVNVGQESVLELPQGVDGANSYDVDFLEAASTTWEVFGESIRLCDADITLALLGQNLTTEVKEGSFAAARVHGDVRQAFIEFDNRALTQTIYTQIARPFAALNFGDADLAPWTSRDIMPYEDNATLAQTFSSFSAALLALRNAGVELEDPAALAWSMGVDLRKAAPRAAAPTQVAAVEAQAAQTAPAAPEAVTGPRVGAAAPAKFDHIDFTPPAGVQKEAQRGLDWRREYGRGGTAVGIARARDLAAGRTISPSTARRMSSYFARHEVDQKGEGWSPGEDGFPSAGRIAWALWGGDAGRSWAAKLARQMDAAEGEAAR